MRITLYNLVMVHQLTKQFEWTFSEYRHKEKDSKWRLAFTVVVIMATVIALLLGNTLLAGVILLGGFLLYYLSQKEPKEMTLQISERGIRYEEIMYPYEKIISFWISEPDKEESSHLLLLTNRNIFPMLSIPLPEGIDLLSLRTFLDDFIEEQELKEPWIHKIVDHIGI